MMTRLSRVNSHRVAILLLLLLIGFICLQLTTNVVGIEVESKETSSKPTSTTTITQSSSTPLTKPDPEEEEDSIISNPSEGQEEDDEDDGPTTRPTKKLPPPSASTPSAIVSPSPAASAFDPPIESIPPSANIDEKDISSQIGDAFLANANDEASAQPAPSLTPTTPATAQSSPPSNSPSTNKKKPTDKDTPSGPSGVIATTTTTTSTADREPVAELLHPMIRNLPKLPEFNDDDEEEGDKFGSKPTGAPLTTPSGGSTLGTKKGETDSTASNAKTTTSQPKTEEETKKTKEETNPPDALPSPSSAGSTKGPKNGDESTSTPNSNAKTQPQAKNEDPESEDPFTELNAPTITPVKAPPAASPPKSVDEGKKESSVDDSSAKPSTIKPSGPATPSSQSTPENEADASTSTSPPTPSVRPPNPKPNWRLGDDTETKLDAKSPIDPALTAADKEEEDEEDEENASDPEDTLPTDGTTTQTTTPPPSSTTPIKPPPEAAAAAENPPVPSGPPAEPEPDLPKDIPPAPASSIPTSTNSNDDDSTAAAVAPPKPNKPAPIKPLKPKLPPKPIDQPSKPLSPTTPDATPTPPSGPSTELAPIATPGGTVIPEIVDSTPAEDKTNTKEKEEKDSEMDASSKPDDKPADKPTTKPKPLKPTKPPGPPKPPPVIGGEEDDQQPAEKPGETKKLEEPAPPLASAALPLCEIKSVSVDLEPSEKLRLSYALTDASNDPACNQPGYIKIEMSMYPFTSSAAQYLGCYYSEEITPAQLKDDRVDDGRGEWSLVIPHSNRPYIPELPYHTRVQLCQTPPTDTSPAEHCQLIASTQTMTRRVTTPPPEHAGVRLNVQLKFKTESNLFKKLKSLGFDEVEEGANQVALALTSTLNKLTDERFQTFNSKRIVPSFQTTESSGRPYLQIDLLPFIAAFDHDQLPVKDLSERIRCLFGRHDQPNEMELSKVEPIFGIFTGIDESSIYDPCEGQTPDECKLVRPPTPSSTTNPPASENPNKPITDSDWSAPAPTTVPKVGDEWDSKPPAEPREDDDFSAPTNPRKPPPEQDPEYSDSEASSSTPKPTHSTPATPTVTEDDVIADLNAQTNADSTITAPTGAERAWYEFVNPLYLMILVGGILALTYWALCIRGSSSAPSTVNGSNDEDIDDLELGGVEMNPTGKSKSAGSGSSGAFSKISSVDDDMSSVTSSPVVVSSSSSSAPSSAASTSFANSKEEGSASKFLISVLISIGIPSFGTTKYSTILKDNYLSTIAQLKQLDNSDWKRLGLPLVIEEAVRKALTDHTNKEGRFAPVGGSGEKRAKGLDLKAAKKTTAITKDKPKKKGGLTVSALASSPSPDDEDDPYNDEPAVESASILAAPAPPAAVAAPVEEKTKGSKKKKKKQSLLAPPPGETDLLGNTTTDVRSTASTSSLNDDEWLNDF